MRYNLLFVTTLTLCLFNSGCKKDKEFLDRPPLNNLVENNLWRNESDAVKGMNSVYSVLRAPGLFMEAFFKTFEVASDDVTWSEALGNYLQMDDLNYNSAWKEWEDMWQHLYAGIQRSNLVLDKLPGIEMSAERKRTLEGEAKFFRAFYHWYLTTLFGKVQYFSKAPVAVDELYSPQLNREETFKKIEKDLIEAGYLLPVNWSGGDIGRVTKWTAKAFLGKAYLHEASFDKSYYNLAKDTLGFVVNNSLLAAKFSSMAYKSNFDYKVNNGDESLLEIQAEDNAPTLSSWGFGFIEGGISGLGNYLPLVIAPVVSPINGFSQIIATKDLFNEFEPSDPRLTETLYLVGDSTLKYTDPLKKVGYTEMLFRLNRNRPQGGVRFGESKWGEFFHIKKYNHGPVSKSTSTASQVGDSPANIVLLRYADVKLMYAEALAEAAGAATPLAIQQLNDVRRRARGGNNDILPDFPYTTTYGGNLNYIKKPNLTITPPASKEVAYAASLEDFRKAIVHERRVELAFEFHRMLDLIRWARIPGHPGSAFTVFSSKSTPISREEDMKVFGERNLLFPKPQYEIDKYQGAVTQNPGY